MPSAPTDLFVFNIELTVTFKKHSIMVKIEIAKIPFFLAGIIQKCLCAD